MQLSLLVILVVSFTISGLFLFFLPPKHESVGVTIAAVVTPAALILSYLLLTFDEFGLLTLVAVFSACTAIIGSTSAAAFVAILKRKTAAR
ncbi:MAG: hypothetical protein J0L82_16010 [Deltaproteobacteria bacterium]|nr:hypothetical protein [Deltaproteobacteria bacterium]